MDMWKLPWRPLPFHYYQRVTVEQLMHAIGSSPSVLTGYLSLAPEMKRRTWIMESCPVKVSMTGLKLGKVKFLASRFERHNTGIWKWEVSNDKLIFEQTGFYCFHVASKYIFFYLNKLTFLLSLVRPPRPNQGFSVYEVILRLAGKFAGCMIFEELMV